MLEAHPDLHAGEATLLERLEAHAGELARWNPRLSLVGPGTAHELVRRHYLESLAAWPLLLSSADDLPNHSAAGAAVAPRGQPEAASSLVDLGTGGGFPGFVLAAALAAQAEGRAHGGAALLGGVEEIEREQRSERVGWEKIEASVVLVEPRQRKVAFLRAALRAARLSCSILDARVETPLSGVRGLPTNIDIVTVRALALAPSLIRELFDRHPDLRLLLWSGRSEPELPPSVETRRRVRLAGSDHRQILEIRRVPSRRRSDVARSSALGSLDARARDASARR
ncbi:MAG: RsmG family class I SAM-dependent methyltransferase [Acidobacteriota bacterium]